MALLVAIECDRDLSSALSAVLLRSLLIMASTARPNVFHVCVLTDREIICLPLDDVIVTVRCPFPSWSSTVGLSSQPFIRLQQHHTWYSCKLSGQSCRRPTRSRLGVYYWKTLGPTLRFPIIWQVGWRVNFPNVSENYFVGANRSSNSITAAQQNRASVCVEVWARGLNCMNSKPTVSLSSSSSSSSFFLMVQDASAFKTDWPSWFPPLHVGKQPATLEYISLAQLSLHHRKLWQDTIQPLLALEDQLHWSLRKGEESSK